jgi:hypothetical protein
MVVVIIFCCMILLGLLFIYIGWKDPWDAISWNPGDILFEFLFVAIEKLFKVSAVKLMRVLLMIVGTALSVFSSLMLIAYVYSN